MNETVLVIGGSDSSGGAGIARDIATLAAFGVSAAVAVTAVTAQTDASVSEIHHVPPSVILEQIRTAFAARNIAAIKIGMLGCSASVEAVLSGLSNTHCPIVLDPVLVSSSGRALLEERALARLRSELLPLATLLTPNVPEAATLLRTVPAVDEATLIAQGRALLELGPKAVLLKAGHASSVTATDLLLTADGVERLVGIRWATTLRGTGCMLAAAITSGIALHKSLLEACTLGKQFVAAQLQASLQRR